MGCTNESIAPACTSAGCAGVSAACAAWLEALKSPSSHASGCSALAGAAAESLPGQGRRPRQTAHAAAWMRAAVGADKLRVWRGRWAHCPGGHTAGRLGPKTVWAMRWGERSDMCCMAALSTSMAGSSAVQKQSKVTEAHVLAQECRLHLRMPFRHLGLPQHCCTRKMRSAAQYVAE